MSVKSNYFKTTSINVGDSVTMIITDLKDGKYGPVYVGTVNGNAVEIQPSGNLKFLAEQLADGKKQLNTPYTVTRKADVKTKSGFTSTQFDVNPADADAAQPAANAVADKLAAIRAKRANTATNS